MALEDHIRDHVNKLVALGTSCPDEDRRLDAIRSLGLMVFLIEGPPEPDDGEENPLENVGGEILVLDAFRDLRKAA